MIRRIGFSTTYSSICVSNTKDRKKSEQKKEKREKERRRRRRKRIRGSFIAVQERGMRRGRVKRRVSILWQEAEIVDFGILQVYGIPVGKGRPVSGTYIGLPGLFSLKMLYAARVRRRRVVISGSQHDYSSTPGILGGNARGTAHRLVDPSHRARPIMRIEFPRHLWASNTGYYREISTCWWVFVIQRREGLVGKELISSSLRVSRFLASELAPRILRIKENMRYLRGAATCSQRRGFFIT